MVIFLKDFYFCKYKWSLWIKIAWMYHRSGRNWRKFHNLSSYKALCHKVSGKRNVFSKVKHLLTQPVQGDLLLLLMNSWGFYCSSYYSQMLKQEKTTALWYFTFSPCRYLLKLRTMQWVKASLPGGFFFSSTSPDNSEGLSSNPVFDTFFFKFHVNSVTFLKTFSILKGGQ